MDFDLRTGDSTVGDCCVSAAALDRRTGGGSSQDGAGVDTTAAGAATGSAAVSATGSGLVAGSVMGMAGKIGTSSPTEPVTCAGGDVCAAGRGASSCRGSRARGSRPAPQKPHGIVDLDKRITLAQQLRLPEPVQPRFHNARHWTETRQFRWWLLRAGAKNTTIFPTFAPFRKSRRATNERTYRHLAAKKILPRLPEPQYFRVVLVYNMLNAIDGSCHQGAEPPMICRLEAIPARYDRCSNPANLLTHS